MGTIIVRRDASVLVIELSNPGRANALDLEMLSRIDEQVALVEADRGIRVVLLRGAAGGVFSSGADIREWSPLAPEAFGRDWVAHGNAILRRVERLRCPTVAAIEGACIGGGLELALCADLRVASTAARLRFPEVTIGMIPGWEGGTRLAKIAGRARALDAVLTAREIDAATAERWGLLSAVWPVADFEARLGDLVHRLTRVSPHAAALAKAAIVTEPEPEAFYETAARDCRASPDAEIGVRAFFEKKPAVF